MTGEEAIPESPLHKSPARVLGSGLFNKLPPDDGYLEPGVVAVGHLNGARGRTSVRDSTGVTVITIAERVHVPHPPEIVWSVLSDPEKVVACIEGSQLGEYHDDGSFDAQIAVRFAAIRVAFKARGNLVLDEANRTGRLEARGADLRGSTRVHGHGAFGVTPNEQGSVVDIDGQLEVNGPLASLVTTGAAVVVERMKRSFATQLVAMCAVLDATPAPVPATAEPPVKLGGGWLVRISARLRRAWQRLRQAARWQMDGERHHETQRHH